MPPNKLSQQKMSTNFHNELRELERCAPLSRRSDSQTDWLLGSSHVCYGVSENAAGTTEAGTSMTAPPPLDDSAGVGGGQLPVWTAKQVEEEAVSEGLSAVDSASTPPAAKPQVSHAQGQSTSDGLALEPTIVTLEVSSSSSDADRVLLPHPTQRLTPNTRNRHTNSNNSGDSGNSSRKVKRRPTAKRDRGTVQGRRPLSAGTPGLGLMDPPASAPVVTLVSEEKLTALLRKNAEKKLERNAVQALSPMPELKKQTYGVATAPESSPTPASRENSVATVPAAQKDLQNGGAAMVQRVFGNSHRSPSEVIVSSESENETGSRGTAAPCHAEKEQNRRSRRHNRHHNDQASTLFNANNLLNEESTMKSVSALDVEVLNVVEVTAEGGEEVDERAADWSRNADRTTFTHRCSYNKTNGPEEGELVVKSRRTRSLCPESEDGEDISFSEMKRVAAEEETKEERRRLEESEREVTLPPSPSARVPQVEQPTRVATTRTVKNIPRPRGVQKEPAFEAERQQRVGDEDGCMKRGERKQQRDSPPPQTRGLPPTPEATPGKSTPIAGETPISAATPLGGGLQTEEGSPVPFMRVSSYRTFPEAGRARTASTPAPAAAPRISTTSAPIMRSSSRSAAEFDVITNRPCSLSEPAYLNPRMNRKVNQKCCNLM